jgi:hypothetical protein
MKYLIELSQRSFFKFQTTSVSGDTALEKKMIDISAVYANGLYTSVHTHILIHMHMYTLTS